MAQPLDRRALERLLSGAREAAQEAAGAGDAAGAAGGRASASADVVLGKYRLVREVGRGGMGVVWEAWDAELGRRAAVKILAASLLADADARERFVREARAAARVVHPHVAAVYDAGDAAIAMQFVDGAPLSSLRGADVRTLVRLVRDAARGVAAAHEQGVVHRDLKPHNLLVEGERVFVTDFGLAKDARLDASLSRTGAVLGTPAYMAPEQAAGRARDANAQSDVWSLGATLYDVLAGHPPFEGADVVDLLRRIAESEPPALRTSAPHVPRDVERVVHKCLSKDPARRYPSAAALADDLTRWLEGRPVEARAPSWGYRLAMFARRRAALLAVAVAALAVSLTFGGALWIERGKRATASRAVELTQRVANTLADVDMHRRLGELERANARLDAALADVRLFLGAHEVAAARILEGRLLRAGSRDDAALAAFDRALELDAGAAAAHLQRGLLLAARAGTLAARALVAGDGAATTAESLAALTERARADLEAARPLAARERSTDAELARAESLRLTGRSKAARAAFAEVLRLDPLHGAAKLALSELALAEGDDEEAWTLAMGVLDLDRGFGPAYAARSRLDAGASADVDVPLVAVAGLGEPLREFGPALRSAPSDAYAHANRGVAQLRELATSEGPRALELAARAAESFQAALTIEPSLAPAWYDLGVALGERARRARDLGRPDEADQDARRAVQAFERAAALRPDASCERARARTAALLESLATSGAARHPDTPVARD